MDVLGTVVSILSCLCSQNCVNESLGQEGQYLRRPKAKLDELRRKMEMLNALSSDVKEKLENMQMQHGREPKKWMELWLRNVGEIEGEVTRILHESTTLSRYSPNKRIKFGKRIEQKIQQVCDLTEGMSKSSDDWFTEKLKRGHTIPTTLLVENPSTMQHLNEIWTCLMDSKVSRIGVYGMGGIGKTTIMKEVHNRLLKETTRFDCIIWVTLIKESNHKRIQKDIAKEMKIKFGKDKTETQKCAELYEALHRRNRFVLILDNLWESFSLDDVGIPILTAENGRKLILTTRSKSVCRHLETDRDVEIKVFAENDAWSLFMDKVGEEALSNPIVESFAKLVAQKCGGLPLAIVTVGRAMRGVTDISEWEDTLNEVRASAARIEGMEKQVFSKLIFSFTKLEDDTSRSCFLFCSLYPEGHQIDTNELIEYWMWEGLLGDIGSIQDKKQKGKTILKELKSACLLESVAENGNKYVRMHDLIRDMAIAITRTSPRCLVKPGIGLRKPPHDNEWVEDVQRVSLMRNDLKGIHLKPRCPKLTTLLLQHNSIFHMISHSFFSDMLNLTVLDLSYTRIEFLPESLFNLKNLCALLLKHCLGLSSLPSLSRLLKLEVLDLSWCSGIKALPQGMEHLINLIRLNLTGTRIDTFPPGLLAELSRLEELLMSDCRVLWGFMHDGSIADGAIIEEDGSVEDGAIIEEDGSVADGAIIEEVISSTSLSCLEVNFQNMNVFDFYVRSMHWKQLDKFKFKINIEFNINKPFMEERCERSIAIGGNFLLEGRPILLPNTSGLYLHRCHDIEQLSMYLSNLMELKSCKLDTCERMEYIVRSGENNFSALERMSVFNLRNLRVLCEGPMEPHTFTSLKAVEVTLCESLSYLFSAGLAKHLQNLEEIKVSHSHITHLIKEEEEQFHQEGHSNAGRINFPKLKSIKLLGLRKLKSIYDGVIVCQSLQLVDVLICDALKRLPLAFCNDNLPQPSSTPALPKIKGTLDWWESLEWDQHDAKSILQQYFIKQAPVMFQPYCGITDYSKDIVEEFYYSEDSLEETYDSEDSLEETNA